MKYSFATTLRLSPTIATEIENIADSLRMSKSDFIRRAVRRAIKFAREHELPLLTARVREALR